MDIMCNAGKFAVRILMASLAVSAVAQAEDFRVQAQLSYDNINPSGDGVPDADALSLSGTYFFAPVPTDGVPVGEAAFIARTSYANVVASRLDFGPGDVDALAANVGYHVPNTIFFGRVGIVRTEFPDLGGGSEDDTSWNGTFGIVPIPRLFFGTDFTEDGWDPNITAKYVGKLENSHWYAASVSATDPDEGDTSVGLEFDYYFVGFKLGGGISTGNDRWTVRAEKGLPHGFALLGRIFGDDDSDGFGLTLTWRDL
jgi:hypothetical protein